MQDHADPAEHRLQLLTAHRAAQDLVRTLRGIAFSYLAAAVVLALLLTASARLPILAELRRSGVGGLALAALLPGLAGLAATWLMLEARCAALGVTSAAANPAGRAARWPQIAGVAPLGIAAAALAWRLRPQALPLAAPLSDAYWLAGAAILLAFPLLVAERTVAAVPASRLPETADLRALLFLPVLAWTAAGLIELAASAGFALAVPLGGALAGLIGGVGIELALRVLGRAFLPPPAPDAARAATHATLARLVADRAWARNGIAAPIRQHLGIDFARSWALAYARAAGPLILLLLLLLAWGLSGVVLVPIDRRAVYERFSAPVAVLQPGLHLVLPWPFGRAVAVEFGALHEIGVSDAATGPVERGSAEAPAPPSADRLWEQVHPAELAFLVAGQGRGGQQSFQTVSADLRVLYRVGLSDDDALRATYATAAPEAVVRAAAGRVLAGFFAGQTLDAVLGADREAMAERLRDQLRAALQRFGSGLDIVAMVVEAIHPPAGAASAYRGVQAAAIAAEAGVSAERGRALAVQAASGQRATDLVNEARGGAAEATGAARAELSRFAADREAAAAGGPAFLLERYFASLAASLPRVPLTVIDSRIEASGGAVLDLRPTSSGVPGAAPGPE